MPWSVVVETMGFEPTTPCGCPLGTGNDCCEWHAGGTTGEDDLAWPDALGCTLAGDMRRSCGSLVADAIRGVSKSSADFETPLSVRVGEPPAGVVDYGAVVAGSKTRCPLLAEVAGLGCAAMAVSWADRRGLRGAWQRPN